MAVCDFCDQEMLDGVGCTTTSYDDFQDGVTRERLPLTVGRATPEGRCFDCQVPVGALHHPGCGEERCPACRGQAMSCGCAQADDEDEEGEGGDEPCCEDADELSSHCAKCGERCSMMGHSDCTGRC